MGINNMGDKLLEKRRERRKKRIENVRNLRETQWLIICEGEKTEPNYFKGLVAELNLKGINKIDIKTCGEGTSTKSLVKRVDRYFEYCDKVSGATKIPYAKIILIFDQDGFGAEKFNTAIQMAKQRYPTSIVAWSNESFELWLCLHFEYEQSPLHRNNYNDKLTAIFRSNGEFTNRQNYEKHGKNLDNIFKSITKCGGSYKTAIRNARKLAAGKDLHNPAKCNPTTMVFEAVDVLIAESEES